MRATMMLADHAQVADGKLFISGGGWTSCAAGPIPCAVVALFHVPWRETGKKVTFLLRLIDEDGHGVYQPGAQDNLPVQVKGSFEARRPAEMLPGGEVNVPMVFNIVLHLDAGHGYSWTLDVDGQDSEDWRVSFETRQPQPARR